jgi:hypothetical protein
MPLSSGPPSPDWDPLDVDARLETLGLTDQEIVAAGWTDSLRDFQVDLADGRTIHFSGCLQASLQRGITPSPSVIRGWWTDEPSAVLATLAQELRALYHHVIFDLDESTLRVVFRDVIVVGSDRG